jgi:hypothetical protein
MTSGEVFSSVKFSEGEGDFPLSFLTPFHLLLTSDEVLFDTFSKKLRRLSTVGYHGHTLRS